MTVFSQIIEMAPKYEFRKGVVRCDGDHRIRIFSCWNQFLCLAFVQMTHRLSLRDIVAILHAMLGKLYHVGSSGNAARSTFAEANESRSWRICKDFARIPILRLRKFLQGDDLNFVVEGTYMLLTQLQ